MIALACMIGTKVSKNARGAFGEASSHRSIGFSAIGPYRNGRLLSLRRDRRRSWLHRQVLAPGYAVS